MPDYSDDEIDKVSDDISESDEVLIDGKPAKSKYKPGSDAENVNKKIIKLLVHNFDKSQRILFKNILILSSFMVGLVDGFLGQNWFIPYRKILLIYT